MIGKLWPQGLGRFRKRFGKGPFGGPFFRFGGAMLYGDACDEAQPDVIEVKAAGATGASGAAGAGDLERLLQEFTAEMRAQFDLFRRLRAGAESLIDGADEGLAKQARADIKAATDAIALIVRTLEKIDALLRQLERDRLDAEERLMEARDPEVLRGEVEALIAARVEAMVAVRVEAALAAQRAEVAGLAEGRGPP